MPKKAKEEAAVMELENPFTPDVTVSGSYPTLQRLKTGLFSLDMALSHGGNLGLPLRNIVELFGYVGVGKSTLAYFLSGKVAQYVSEQTKQKGNIAICDIEMLDRDYLRFATGVAGYTGNIHLSAGVDEKQKLISHEDMMMEMTKTFANPDTGASVLDSVSAIQSMNEQTGDLGEAFMGRRAKLVAQLARVLSGLLRNKEQACASFIINHAYQIVGGRGHTTAGGIVLPALAGVRAMLWTGESFMDDKTDKPLGFLVQGQVEKLRFGGKGGKFQFYIVPGLGVHTGVTAMFDCFDLGLAERDARVKLDGKSIGYLKADLLTYAAEGKTRRFAPFMELIEKQIRKEEQLEE